MLNAIITFIKQIFFSEKIDGIKTFIGGMPPHPEDARDFKYSALVGLAGPYKPLHDVLDIPGLSVKAQYPFNTCVWNSYVSQREDDQKVRLTPRSIVAYARKMGYLTGNGFAYLRDSQKAGIEFGIADESSMTEQQLDWDTYSSANILTPSVVQNALTHRAQSYFLADNKDAFFHALDQGRTIQCVLDWYSKYNMSGGFQAPWILPWKQGVNVGGHSMKLRGYDLVKGLLKFQNSFGLNWGDGGCCYIKISDWFGETPVGFLPVAMDGTDLSRFLQQYEGKQVKGSGPTIFSIENGIKRAYPDEITFYAFGGRFSPPTFASVSQGLLDRLQYGLPMDISASPEWTAIKDHWNTIKWLKSPDSFARVDELINPK